jgi:hypothetical protein
MTLRPEHTSAATPRSHARVLGGLAFAASFLMLGAAHAQSVDVRIDGLSDRAVHRALVSAATQVCRADDHSPLAPLAETVCIEDTVAVAEKKVAEIRRQIAENSAFKTASADAPSR